MRIADALIGAGSFGIPLALAAFALSGCTAAEVTNPGGAVDTDDLVKGTTVQVSADAQKVAQIVETAKATEGVYPTNTNTLAIQMTGANTVRNYYADAAGFTFCVVEPTSGAWTRWDSASGGRTGSGESGATCVAG